MGFPPILLAAIVTCLAFTKESWLAGIIAVVITIFTTTLLFLKPDHQGSEHKQFAEKYMALRNEIRFFRELELTHSNRSRHELLEKLAQFSKRKDELNADCLPIPEWAYIRAKKHMLEGGTSYDVDAKKT